MVQGTRWALREHVQVTLVRQRGWAGAGVKLYGGQMQSFACPECSHRVDIASAAKAAPGDWTVCGRCTAILRIDERLQLRSTTLAERVDAPPETVRVVALVSMFPNHDS